MGANCDNKTPPSIREHPIILLSPKIWFKIIHAVIAANTPSRDITIAAGAGEIFFWPKSCKTNAAPPDKTPAYKISNVSNLIFEKSISSNNTANKKDNAATIKFCSKAIKNGKSN